MGRRDRERAWGGDGVYHRPLPDAQPAVDPDELRSREGVLSVDTAGDALVVIRTPPGKANRVAEALDRLRCPSVVGTIAGDDTIFVATRDQGGQRHLVAQLWKLSSV